MQLTETEKRLLEIVRRHEVVTLRDLSEEIGLSRVHTQSLTRKLERRGYLDVPKKRYRTDPLRIKLSHGALIYVRPDFDKLLFSTAWG